LAKNAVHLAKWSLDQRNLDGYKHLEAPTIWPRAEKLAKWVVTTSANLCHQAEYWPNGRPAAHPMHGLAARQLPNRNQQSFAFPPPMS
jgi:hypothetical protein